MAPSHFTITLYTSAHQTCGSPAATFTERLLYRGAQVGQVVITGSESFTETFLYRPDGAPLELLYQRAGQPTARYWYALDGQGSVVALTDASGQVVDRYAYDLWGAPVVPSGGTTPYDESVHQPLRYHGYWYDGWDDSLGSTANQGWNTNAALSWYWLPTRPYDPRLRRFLQPDPSADAMVPDYVYANDDPLDVSDPSGQAGSAAQCGQQSYTNDLVCGMPVATSPSSLRLTKAVLRFTLYPPQHSRDRYSNTAEDAIRGMLKGSGLCRLRSSAPRMTTHDDRFDGLPSTLCCPC